MTSPESHFDGKGMDACDVCCEDDTNRRASRGIPRARPDDSSGRDALEEFLRPFGPQQRVVADELGIGRNRLNEPVLRKRSVTADTAIRLERRFKMPARFWLHLLTTIFRPR